MIKTLTDEDWTFIEQQGHILTGLTDNFRTVNKIPPVQRLDWARQQIKRVYRDGNFNYANIRIAEAETIHDHTESLVDLVKKYSDSADAERNAHIARNHDISESIANVELTVQGQKVKCDLNPIWQTYKGHTIEKAVKHRLEGLAVKVMLLEFPEEEALVHEYQQQSSEGARFVKGLDSVITFIKCLHYTANGYPQEHFCKYWEILARRIDQNDFTREALGAFHDAQDHFGVYPLKDYSLT